MPLRAAAIEIDLTPPTRPIEKPAWIVRQLATQIDDRIFAKIILLQSANRRFPVSHSHGNGQIEHKEMPMPRIQIWMLIFLLAGCNALKRTPPSAYYPRVDDPNYELTANPTILLTAQQDWAKMTLHGFHLGDDASTINPKLIVESNKGWDMLPDGNRLSIGDDGKIDALGLRDIHSLNQLGVNAQGDIQKQFGKAQHIIDLNDGSVYLFQDQHIHVIWKGIEHSMVAVNVVKRVTDDMK